MTKESEGGEDSLAESKLEEGLEALYRQVHPSWVQEGVPSSLAFRPTKKDDGMLSISLGSKIGPEAAYRHHVDDLGFESAGTWAVTVAEVNEVGLDGYAQPLDESPAHGYVDFRGLSRSATDRAAKLLVAKARGRGCQYEAEAGPDG